MSSNVRGSRNRGVPHYLAKGNKKPAQKSFPVTAVPHGLDRSLPPPSRQGYNPSVNHSLNHHQLYAEINTLEPHRDRFLPPAHHKVSVDCNSPKPQDGFAQRSPLHAASLPRADHEVPAGYSSPRPQDGFTPQPLLRPAIERSATFHYETRDPHYPVSNHHPSHQQTYLPDVYHPGPHGYEALSVFHSPMPQAGFPPHPQLRDASQVSQYSGSHQVPVHLNHHTDHTTLPSHQTPPLRRTNTEPTGYYRLHHQEFSTPVAQVESNVPVPLFALPLRQTNPEPVVPQSIDLAEYHPYSPQETQNTTSHEFIAKHQARVPPLHLNLDQPRVTQIPCPPESPAPFSPSLNLDLITGPYIRDPDAPPSPIWGPYVPCEFMHE
ncbi:Protein of unknown function [Pyronema omphalodes CBS 100304]|uniref:Uncharacterized protein n=1 Tax=Pyronema omphalodes (strain CBS 100304) TaxID=1076935 RepID=U4LVA5_PYROM|nr:Protein of unknown function [Pyronema omphalodes CBS 100304]